MRKALIAFCIMAILLNIAYLAQKKQQPQDTTATPFTPTSPTKQANTFTLGPHGQTMALELSANANHGNDLNPRKGQEILRGTVLTTSGSPASNADILIAQPPAREKLLEPTAKAYRWHQRTQDDGSFEFTTLPKGTLIAFARLDNDHAIHQVHLDGITTSGDIALRLKPSTAISGTIQTRDGESIPGARIFPVQPETATPYTYLPAHANSQGQFNFPFLTPQLGDFLIIAKGYAPTLAQLDDSTNTLQATLDIGKAFEGTLYNEQTKRYISNARLRLTETTYGLEHTTHISKSGGTFRFDALRPGTYALQIQSETYALENGAVMIDIVSGETTPDLELTVQRAGQIRGRILDRKGINGIEKAQVIATALHEGIKLTRSATTDMAGYYRITGLAAGPYQIQAIPPAPIILQEPTTVEVEAQSGKQIKGPDFQVGESSRITGIVLDANGHPASNASVMLGTPESATATRTVRTDSDGLFVLKHVDPNASVRIWAEKGSNVSIGYGPVQAGSAGLTDLTFSLDLTQGASILGTVVNAQGEAQSGITLHCTPPDTSLTNPLKTQTDEAGQYQFTRLIPGTYRLHALPDPENEDNAHKLEILVESDTHFRDANITLP